MSILKNIVTAAETTINMVYLEENRPSKPSDRLDKLAAFLGLPYQKPITIETQTGKNLAKNFFGLRDDILKQRNWRKKAFIPVFILWHIVRFPFRLILNSLRLLTEFLPLFFSNLFILQAKELLLFSKDLQSKHPWRTALADGLHFLGLICSCIYMLARCVTSPISSVQLAWDYGHSFETGSIAGHLMGLMMAMVSITLTTIAFTWLLPLLLTTLLGPTMVTGMANTLGFLDGIGKISASLLGFSFSSNTAAMLAGLAISVSLAITIPGTLINRFVVEPIETWWNRIVWKSKKSHTPFPTHTIEESGQSKILKKLSYKQENDSKSKSKIFTKTKESYLFPPISSSEEEEIKSGEEDFVTKLFDTSEEEESNEDQPLLRRASRL